MREVEHLSAMGVDEWLRLTRPFNTLSSVSLGTTSQRKKNTVALLIKAL